MKNLGPKHDHIQDLDQVYMSRQYSYFYGHDMAGNPDLATLVYYTFSHPIMNA